MTEIEEEIQNPNLFHPYANTSQFLVAKLFRVAKFSQVQKDLTLKLFLNPYFSSANTQLKSSGELEDIQLEVEGRVVIINFI